MKAFNTTYATTLPAGVVVGQPLDVFGTGDEADAKGKVAELVKSRAIRIVDVGPLSRARRIDGMHFLHIVEHSGLGPNCASTIEILS